MAPSRFRQRLQLLELARRLDRRRREEHQRRQARAWRALLRQTVDPFTMPDAEFVRTFRLTKNGVRELAQCLIPLMPEERRIDAISAMRKILIALSLFATGSYQTLVGQSAFNSVSQTSVSRALRQVTAALNDPEVFKKYVKWPQQREERNLMKSGFYNKFKIPGVLGCIDGTHVAIIRPAIHEERYYNRKGYHSQNVMIICDSDLNILCVDPSTPGAAHDSTIWQNHPLCQHMDQLYNDGEEVFLLGDSGYPLRRTMLTPILNTAEGTKEHHFYTAQVRARNTVERCIGLLKARFRCLLAARALHYSPTRAGQMVNACSVLHNYANQTRTPIQLLTPEEIEVENSRQIENLRAEAGAIMQHNDERSRRVNRQLLEGRALQRAIVERLWRDRNRF